MTQINFNYYSFKQTAIIVLFVAFSGCHRNINFKYDNKNQIIVKVGETYYSKSEFETVCNTIQGSTVSKDSAIKRTLRACIVNANILKYLDCINFELSRDDKKELDIINRSTLIKLAQDSLIKYIPINLKDVTKAIEMFKGKQIVIDFIWLPKKDSKIIEECLSFLNSGGSAADMIYSDKKFFERVTKIGGQIRRLNVKPGQFSFKISKFISTGKEGETEVIREKNGFYVIKILYSKKDDFQHWDYDDIERNFKLSSYLNGVPLYCNIKIANINLDVLNNADFSIGAPMRNTSYAAEFLEKKITLEEIKDWINSLPFNEKIYFNNLSCMPSAVAILILLKANKHPVTTKDLGSELFKGEDLDFWNEEKTNTVAIDNYFEYQRLQTFEKSTCYPWIFPFLFKERDNVSLNYDLLYKNQLVNFKKCNPKDRIAFSANGSYLTVEDFIKELDAIDKASAAKMMNIDNAKKLIYYNFEKQGKTSQKETRIDKNVLESVLLEYIQKLGFQNFTSGLFRVTDRNPRRYFSGEMQVFNSPELSITISELRELINYYPTVRQLNLQTDQTEYNPYWRLNVLIDIAEQETWYKKAMKLNISRSSIYQFQTKKNADKLRIKSFLKSNMSVFNNSFIDSILKNNKPLNIWIDPKYFGAYNKYINSLE